MDLTEWLKGLGLDQYAAVFAENDIDFDLLSQLTDEDLKDLGVASFGNRKRLLAAIAERNAKPLPAAPIPQAGERRQVTILFADLCGFTALSQSLDPEEVHELVSNYTSLVDNIVVEYEGTVDKHIGDAVMALFGAPQAHDDDPLRAARSALDIHDALDRLKDAKTPRLQAHIGIASGEVVAGRLKRANAHDYTVLGFGELGGPARRRRRAWADPAFRYGLSSPVGPRHL
jgi:class 3 adenylate cyclase